MSQKVLFIDAPSYKPLPDAGVLNIVCGDCDVEITSVTSIESALTSLKSLKEISIVVCNAPISDVFETAKSQQKAVSTILVTDKTMDVYSPALSGKEDALVDHVIANRTPSEWAINELRVTTQKLLTKHVFGIGKYLLPGTQISTQTITGSADRETFNNEVMQFAERNSLGQYLAKLAFGITEELMMNAIYDAPISKGKHQYSEVSRTTAIELAPEEHSTLTFGCDGSVFALAVRDPFGALKREKLFQYIKKVLLRSDGVNLVDTKKGGAGLGLFKILYSSHSLICNVRENKQTEVIALIDINHQVRDFSKTVRSISYFNAN